MVLDLTPESVEAMKVTELKEALAMLGLSTKGVKKDLTARLLEAIASSTSAATAEPMAAPIAPPDAVSAADPTPAAPSEGKLTDAEGPPAAAEPLLRWFPAPSARLRNS